MKINLQESPSLSENKSFDEIKLIPQPIDKTQLEELNTILGHHKVGKARLDMRVKSAENWWKMRNLFEEQKTTDPKNTGFRAATAWLHNTIAQKQAAAMEAYSEG